MVNGMDDFNMREYVMAQFFPSMEDFALEVPNGVFAPKRHNYNANNKRKKRKRK